MGASYPRLPLETSKLVAAMQQLSPEELERLMGISSKLALLNKTRFLTADEPLSIEDPDCRRSLFCFDGDACGALDPETLGIQELGRLETQLRFISGLYGVLRPSDLIRAHRLEMGTRPGGIEAKSLYSFWGGKISSLLMDDATACGASEALSLASEEYDKAARQGWNQKRVKLHSTRFETICDGVPKNISMDAKRARGLFARHLASKDFDSVESACESFSLGGWRLSSMERRTGAGALWIFEKHLKGDGNGID